MNTHDALHIEKKIKLSLGVTTIVTLIYFDFTLNSSVLPSSKHACKHAYACIHIISVAICMYVHYQSYTQYTHMQLMLNWIYVCLLFAKWNTTYNYTNKYTNWWTNSVCVRSCAAQAQITIDEYKHYVYADMCMCVCVCVL